MGEFSRDSLCRISDQSGSDTRRGLRGRVAWFCLDNVPVQQSRPLEQGLIERPSPTQGFQDRYVSGVSQAPRRVNLLDCYLKLGFHHRKVLVGLCAVTRVREEEWFASNGKSQCEGQDDLSKR